MNVEIRPCTREEMAEYGRIVAYVFAENDPEPIDREVQATEPDWTLCAFVDGKLATTMAVIPFTVQLNGSPVEMGGVTAVGTLPEFRRTGLLRRVMTESLERMREQGQSMGILWASMGAIYQRFGYGQTAAMTRYSFDPRHAALEGEPPPSGATRLTPRQEAEPILKSIYEEYLAPRNLLLHRNQFFWDAKLRTEKGKPRYIGVYRSGAGQATGYIVFATRDTGGTGPSQELDVHDFAALDMDAYRGLWEFIRRHDLVKQVNMVGIVAEDDPAPDLLSEPRTLQRSTGDAIWLRVTDVRAALARRRYSESGALVIGIPHDEQCPWNEGRWRLEVTEQGTSVEPTSAAPALSMPPNTLGGLITGFRSATHYARIGRLDVHDASALRVADRVFAADYRPFLPNDF